MSNEARRVIINYRKVDPNALGDWLAENNYKHAFIPYPEATSDYLDGTIGTLLVYVEVYSEEAEIALRLKWECE